MLHHVVLFHVKIVAENHADAESIAADIKEFLEYDDDIKHVDVTIEESHEGILLCDSVN